VCTTAYIYIVPFVRMHVYRCSASVAFTIFKTMQIRKWASATVWTSSFPVMGLENADDVVTAARILNTYRRNGDDAGFRRSSQVYLQFGYQSTVSLIFQVAYSETHQASGLHGHGHHADDGASGHYPWHARPKRRPGGRAGGRWPA
jgi:hypothetical protein